MSEADSDSDQSKEKGPPPAKKDLKAAENQVVTHFHFQKIMMLTKSRATLSWKEQAIQAIPIGRVTFLRQKAKIAPQSLEKSSTFLQKKYAQLQTFLI